MFCFVFGRKTCGKLLHVKDSMDGSWLLHVNKIGTLDFDTSCLVATSEMNVRSTIHGPQSAPSFGIGTTTALSEARGKLLELHQVFLKIRHPLAVERFSTTFMHSVTSTLRNNVSGFGCIFPLNGFFAKLIDRRKTG